MEDLGRNNFLTEAWEYNGCLEYCNHHIDNLDTYMKDIYDDPAIIWSPCSSKVRYEPLGVALIMGSWNFPYFVVLKPLVTCISSGNCAVIKPSELGACSAKVM